MAFRIYANPRLAQPTSALRSFLEEQSQSALFVAETAGRREIFDEMLRKAGIETKPIDNFDDYPARITPTLYYRWATQSWSVVFQSADHY